MVHEIVVTLTSQTSAGSEIMIPAPTVSGNSVHYEYDPYIKESSVVVPIGDDISGRPAKMKSCVVTTGLDGSGNTVGYATITTAETLPANYQIGVLVINR